MRAGTAIMLAAGVAAAPAGTLTASASSLGADVNFATLAPQDWVVFDSGAIDHGVRKTAANILPDLTTTPPITVTWTGSGHGFSGKHLQAAGGSYTRWDAGSNAAAIDNVECWALVEANESNPGVFTIPLPALSSGTRNFRVYLVLEDTIQNTAVSVALADSSAVAQNFNIPAQVGNQPMFIDIVAKGGVNTLCTVTVTRQSSETGMVGVQGYALL